MKQLSKQELELISDRISCIYNDMIARYDGAKYPEDAYRKMLLAFSKNERKNEEIENAMKWKWGHWGKKNYPMRHKNLINIIKELWPLYVDEKCTTPYETFEFWRRKLEKPQRFISIAFITHLIHYESIAIIDQHNYRAMIFLLRGVGRDIKIKKKPSSWQDIIDLSEFLSSISKYISKQEREVDKFLMMYGKYCAPRV